MSRKNKGRKWILSLGFSEAQADSFIENDVPGLKIEALAEVLNSGKIIDQTVTEPSVAAPAEAPAEVTQTPEQPPGPKEEPPDTGFGDYSCPECKGVTHRVGSKIHKRHLKLL